MSNVSEVGWAIPEDFGQAPAALVEQFADTQWWPQADILGYQLRQVARLLEHFAAGSSCFPSRDAGGDPELTLERFRLLPVLTRRAIQEAGDTLISVPPPDHGRTRRSSSSGSTGRPVLVHKTDLTQAFHAALNVRIHRWHQHDFEATFATIRAFADGVAMPPTGERHRRWAAVPATGESLLLNSARCTVAEQLEWLARERPAYVLSYPTNLQALALLARARGMETSWLKGIVTYSEALSPGVRRCIEGVFPVCVKDVYSAAEVSVISIQCPDVPTNQHVQAENLLVEVVDDAGRPTSPGEIGRVLVTDLHNFATPIIRYEIGDLATTGPPCPCGRGLPVLQRVWGRVRNMLCLASGERIFPDIGALRLHEVLPLRQYQMVQRGFTKIDVKLSVARPLTMGEEALLRNLVVDAMGCPFDLDLRYVDGEIPRHPSGKFEDFICEVDP
jgi:phenylacetate-CoA ligase